MPFRGRRIRRGFTLLELLVVIAIIATLVGLLLPAVQRVRDSAHRTKCGNNLRQIGLAMQMYCDQRGSFPAGYLCSDPVQALSTSPGWGWAALILPYLEQEPLYNRINFGVPIEDSSHQAVRTTVLSVFVCPADYNTGIYDVLDAGGAPLTQAATNSYAACFGTQEIAADPDQGDGMFFRNSRVRFNDISDGTSKTLAIGERAALFTRTPWAGAIQGGTARITRGAPTTSTSVEDAPALPLAHSGSHTLNAPNADPDDFFTPHAGSAVFLFVDGSVRGLNKQISLTVLQALSTRSGGEYVNPDGP